MELSVPVVVDDVKTIPGFEMTRCVYFQIEGEDSLVPWTLARRGGPIPFLMLGLAGIVVQPLDDSPEFSQPQQVEELLDFIEHEREIIGDEAELSAELADVWLPNTMLQPRKNEIIRGDVFRIRHELFRHAFAFRSGRLELEEFQGIADRLRDQVAYSEKETDAFRFWAQHEIAVASERSNPELRLRRKEDR